MAIYFGDGSGGGDTTEGRILQIQRITKTDTFSSNSDSFTTAKKYQRKTREIPST